VEFEAAGNDEERTMAVDCKWTGIVEEGVEKVVGGQGEETALLKVACELLAITT
jgi:hypothetical protein